MLTQPESFGKTPADVLPNSERFIQTALDALSAHIAILDETGVILSVNNAWRRFADENGSSGDYGIGDNYLQVCDLATGADSYEAPDVARGIRKIISGELDEFYLEYPCHSPTEKRWFDVRVTQFSNETGMRLIVAHQNITRLKVVEQSLREKERRLRYIVDHAGSGLIITDEHGTIEEINPAVTQIFGYKPDEIVGMNLKLLLPEVEPENWKRRTREREVMGRHQTGEAFPASFMVSEMVMDARRMFTVIVQDITERKRVESERLENERLRIALDKERELRELKDRFLSMISHELRTPLAQILLASDMIRYYGDRTDEAERSQYMDVIKTQVERLTTLINDVLSVSRTQMTVPDFEPQSVDLEAFCYDIAKEMQFFSREHQVIFYSDGKFDGAMVDPKLLHQAISNLITNAIKYSPPHSTIMYELRRKGNSAIIRIIDKGIGIPPEDVPRLFEPFHRAKNVDDRPGTGLGLAITKQAVEMHGGTIKVTSKVDAGSTFTITLPVFQS